MSMSVDKSKGAGGGRVRSRWQLDFSSRSSHGVDLVSPPGYTAGQMVENVILDCITTIFRSRLNVRHRDLSRS